MALRRGRAPAGKLSAFESAVADAGVQLAGLNLYGGNLPGGARGIVSRSDLEAEFAANLDVAIPLAGALNCRVLNVLCGRRVLDFDEREQDETAARNLARAARAAACIGATVVIEPLSAVPDFPLRTATDVAAVIARVGEPNVGILADLYHLAVNGDDVIDVIHRHARSIGHVQLADAPGRVEPGRGTLPIAQFLRELDAVDYRGWIGMEYLPIGETGENLGWWHDLHDLA